MERNFLISQASIFFILKKTKLRKHGLYSMRLRLQHSLVLLRNVPAKYHQVRAGSTVRRQYLQMSAESDDDPLSHSSTEHYDIIGVNLDWFLILGSASSIFFGFLLKIALNPPSYFTLLDKTNLLAALYAMAVSTAMFVTPVIYHTSHYRKFKVNIFVFKTKQYVMIGIICVMLAMYLSLALVLDSKLPILVAYSLASFPFIFVFFRFFKDTRK